MTDRAIEAKIIAALRTADAECYINELEPGRTLVDGCFDLTAFAKALGLPHDPAENGKVTGATDG